MINKQTTLDLNGPILSFTTNPTDVIICAGVAATFIGIATATFPSQTPSNPATNTGIITYRWYDQSGPLSDGTISGVTISGAGTSTLSLYNNTQTRRVFLRADYIPSAYQSASPVTAGTARSTGNSINEPIDSNVANLTLYPLISVTTEPSDASAAQTGTATFTAEGQATDGSDVSYQWQVGCVNAVDGTNTYIPSCGNVNLLTMNVTNETTGQTTTVDFTSVGRYSAFTPGVVYTLVPQGTFSTTIRAVGGKGGDETRAGATGGFGGLAQGTFTFVQNQTYKLIVGGAGVKDGFSIQQQNPAATASGGGSGTQSVSTGGGGQGGGYTGLFRTSITQSNAVLIGAGGGGANRDPGRGSSGGGATGVNNGTNQGAGRTGGPGTQTAGGGGGDGGNPGTALKGGDGVQSIYSSGGGGGYFGGGGGGPAGVGGGGSGFIDNNLVSSASYVTEVSGSFPSGFSGGGFNGRNDGSFEIIFGSGGGSSTYTNTISGATSKSMNISSTNVGSQSIKCIISHPTACNSPISTRSVNFNITPARSVINFEFFGTSSTAELLGWDLFTQGSYTLTSPQTPQIVCFYSPERDIDLILDLYAASGASNGSYAGGQGGVSSIRFTARQNEEYVISPLPQANTGGALYLYRKAALIAVCGGGGNAGSGGNGGPGGGVNVAGGVGSGRGAGNGGQLISQGTLPFPGIFGSTFTNILPPETAASVPLGGRVIPCARGNYWRDLGFSACDNLGNIQFRLADGTLVTNSAIINRGHKAGYGVRQTAGARIGNGGNGAQGATGGSGGVNEGGGGGGSGYTDGSITVVSTQQGGNNGAAKVIFRLAP